MAFVTNMRYVLLTSFLTAICYGLGLSLSLPFSFLRGCWSNGAKERMAELRWRSNKQTQNKPSLCPCICICIFISVCYLSLYLHLCLCLCLCLSSFFLTGGCWSNGAIERMVELRWCSNKQTTSIPSSKNFPGNSALVGISLKTKKQKQKGYLLALDQLSQKDWFRKQGNSQNT